jgi:predicted NAD/FAD-binding protein
VDTGFIVHNDRTYPNLIRLLAELNVETAPSDMSFAVNSSDYEYSSRGAGGFFAQRGNLLRPGHYRMGLDILRFNREAPKLLDDPAAATMTMGEVIEQGGYSDEFTERYLFPMASAVWSMSTDSIRSFPAMTLIRFFDNHGMLGVNTHPKWKVIRGGSNSYIPKLSAPYQTRVRTGVTIQSVVRSEAGVALKFQDRPAMSFDHVVFSCHGNQILPLLDSPSDIERDVLGCFETTRNDVCLHTDSTVLARRPQARASWNYHLHPDSTVPTMTYHMNRLQSLDVPEDYCVTLNANGNVEPSKVLRRFVYHHPVYNRQSVAAQTRWSEISGRNRTHYCGAYWFYGFHEDGLNSALRVARTLGVEC